jgi:hypothetical protein
VARTLATVDVQDFARHEAGPFEIKDRVDDVGDFAQTVDRVQGGELRIPSRSGLPAPIGLK